MSITDFIQKIKKLGLFLTSKDLLMALCIICTSIVSYSLGTMEQNTQKKSGSVVFTDVPRTAAVAATLLAVQENEIYPNQNSNTTQNKTTIFASKSGTKYYFTWCKSGNRVKLENRIYYPSAAAAEKAGKSLAANCTP
ncbi:MAG: hypothetical protein RI996_250 [Candidatus Parcubacteria bacterium]|jgi:hypothetical protein